ncbi:MAG: DUF4249 family protein [Bacteroidales bacterium]|nr:DUF4249 family protein [Bacteroidales bacterium]
MKPRHILLFLLFLCVVVACKKEIIIDTDEFIERPVVEGYIENDAYPCVLITKNQAYFEPMSLDFTDLNDLMKFFIVDAVVIVSDGVVDDTLQFGINPLILEGKYVWPPVRYQGSKFLGEVGKSYSLKILIDDKVYTANTSITTPVMPDSLWFVQDPGIDTMGAIHATFKDDPSQTNYYCYFAKRFGKDSYYVAGEFSLWEDSFFNGKEFEIIVMRGTSYEVYNTDYEEPLESAMLFRVGDTVSVKAVTMDYDSYQFWRTLGGNQVETNIEGGALGVWCGYGAYYCPPIVCVP